MEYQISSPFSLKENASTSERWLQDRIIDDPSILGLGEVELVASEKSLPNAGRLDLLLQDPLLNRRYEVELMLGPTDPSHIIRTIEYWDVERRRYPAYEHVAVIIAEDITTRFLNVMSLLAGSIPLIAIQLSAIRVETRVILHFVRVLDQVKLRTDDAYEAGAGDGGGTADRPQWDQRVGVETMAICDELLSIANTTTPESLELKYRKGRIAVGPSGSFFKAFALHPKRGGFVTVITKLDDRDSYIDRLQSLGLDIRARGEREVALRVRHSDVASRREPLCEVFSAAIKNNLSD